MELNTFGEEFKGTQDYATGAVAVRERHSNGNNFINSHGYTPQAARYDAPSNG